MEELDRADDGGCSDEPLVTFPDPDTPPPTTALASPPLMAAAVADTLRVEQKRVMSASSTKTVMDGVTAEQATANSAELKRIQTSDLSYQEQSAAAAMRARLDIDGVSAEKSLALKQVRSLPSFLHASEC